MGADISSSSGNINLTSTGGSGMITVGDSVDSLWSDENDLDVVPEMITSGGNVALSGAGFTLYDSISVGGSGTLDLTATATDTTSYIGSSSNQGMSVKTAQGDITISTQARLAGHNGGGIIVEGNWKC